jgi:SAM-dependent methyltransferase
MIIHKLIACFFANRGGTPAFYRLQARDAIHWLARSGVSLNSKTTVLDLGCGFGDFGGELAQSGCQVTLADDESYVLPEYSKLPFRRFNIDQDDFRDLGRFDVVICSNVLEHLPRPERMLAAIPDLVQPDGHFYLSWTNWLSPWGGHEFSPYHYLGPNLGYRFYTQVLRKPSQHVPHKNLFPTSIGKTLRMIRSNPGIRIVRIVPRYYPELAFITRIPGVREIFTWNCALLINRRK